MYERVFGDKYNRTLSTKEIAKLIRQEIKTIAPQGFKISTRSEYFSGGSSIDIRIKAIPEGFILFNPAYDPNRPRWGNGENEYYSPEAKKLLDQLEAIMAAYNYDGSETQVDYFDVNFYGSVAFDMYT